MHLASAAAIVRLGRAAVNGGCPSGSGLGGAIIHRGQSLYEVSTEEGLSRSRCHSRVSAEDRIATMFPQSVVGELEACFGVDDEHTILHR